MIAASFVERSRQLVFTFLVMAVLGVAPASAADTGRDDVAALMKVAGVHLDIAELSDQLLSEIEAEMANMPSEQTLSEDEQAATLRAARAAFNTERFTGIIHEVLAQRMSAEDIAVRIDDYSTDLGRRLVALEYTEKRNASGPEFTAFVETFSGDKRQAWRRDEIADMFLRHNVAAEQAAMYVDVQVAVLIGLSHAMPDIDEPTIKALVDSFRSRQSELAAYFEKSGVSFAAWLYRDLDDAEFSQAMAFYESEAARSSYAALIAAYREAIVSGGLVYGQQIVSEQRTAAQLAEI